MILIRAADLPRAAPSRAPSSKTAINGEINCLDPGGYGSVTITKSITIDCTGRRSDRILASFVTGVTVSIPVSDDARTSSVRLRGN